MESRLEFWAKALGCAFYVGFTVNAFKNSTLQAAEC